MKDTGLRDDVAAVRRAFAGHDPAAPFPDDPTARELSRIEVIASGYRPLRTSRLLPRRPLLRPSLVGAAAVLTAAAVLSPLLFRGAPAHAGPPPAPLEVTVAERTESRDRLIDLAEAAEAARPPARGGDVAYVRTYKWALTFSGDSDGKEGWGVQPEETRLWRSPDDSGLQIIDPGEPEYLGGDPGPVLGFPTDASRYSWDPLDKPGTLTFAWKPEELSTDPGALERQLYEATDHTREDAPAISLFRALEELYVQYPVEQRVQAAVLRVLAEHEEVFYAGTTRDRYGREGELFLVEDDQVSSHATLERRIMFDAGTGMPLYYEIVETASPFDPPEGVELPMVNRYVVVVESGWVAEVEDR
ncbi:CU044_5270 family protein, partial [Nocardiopsis protaetiae]